MLQPAIAQQIAIYPPQIHQQIAPESTISRPLHVYNTGDEPLDFSCWFEPWGSNRDTTVSWVSASPMSGNIPAGDSTIIIFDFNSFGLSIENYLVNFMIGSNDPVNPELEVLAMLHVMDLDIFITPEKDSIDPGDSVRLNVVVLGGAENYLYYWTSNPQGFYSTIKDPFVKPLTDTYYILEVTDGGYSRKDSVLIKVTPSSGFRENALSVSSLSVSPNPCKEAVRLYFESEAYHEGLIVIQDISGKEVLIKKINIKRGKNEFSLKTKFFLPGVYFLSLRSRGGTQSAILIKL